MKKLLLIIAIYGTTTTSTVFSQMMGGNGEYTPPTFTVVECSLHKTIDLGDTMSQLPSSIFDKELFHDACFQSFGDSNLVDSDDHRALHEEPSDTNPALPHCFFGKKKGILDI